LKSAPIVLRMTIAKMHTTTQLQALSAETTGFMISGEVENKLGANRVNEVQSDDTQSTVIRAAIQILGKGVEQRLWGFMGVFLTLKGAFMNISTMFA